MRLVIDFNNMFARAFHVKSGDGAFAVYGSINMLLNSLRRHSPDTVHVMVDSTYSVRKERVPTYKQRKEKPDGYNKQLCATVGVLKQAGLSVYEERGYEADDLIAAFVEGLDASEDVIIVSSDKDLMWLTHRSFVAVQTPTKLYRAAEVETKFGVPPRKLLFFMALTGDSSDSIKGVPGIGPVAAKKLVSKYQTVYELLTGPQTTAAERKAAANRDALKESLFLVTPLPVDLQYQFGKYDIKLLHEAIKDGILL